MKARLCWKLGPLGPIASLVECYTNTKPFNISFTFKLVLLLMYIFTYGAHASVSTSDVIRWKDGDQ